MTRERRNKLDAPTAWPDAKLRALSNVAPPNLLSLPWVAPSLPWWPLSGGWKSLAADPKLLMFSRFRATPPSVAALLSFGVEAHCLRPTHERLTESFDTKAAIRELRHYLRSK